MFALVAAGRRQAGEGDAGVPVRPGPVPGPGAGAALACGSVPVRVELGPGQVPGAVLGGAEVVLRRGAAPAVERGEESRPGTGWCGENSKCAYQESFRDLDRALRDFTASRAGERKGRRLGFPRFKKRGKCRDSFRFGSGVMRCCGAAVTLPRLGAVRTH